MKTKIFALVMTLMPLSSVCADAAPVPLTMTITDPTEDQGGPHKGPVLVPKVSIEDYALTFATPCLGYTLELLGEDGAVAYTTVITSDTLVLPSTLSGDYELHLIPTGGSYYFYGYVLF